MKKFVLTKRIIEKNSFDETDYSGLLRIIQHELGSFKIFLIIEDYLILCRIMQYLFYMIHDVAKLFRIIFNYSRL